MANLCDRFQVFGQHLIGQLTRREANILVSCDRSVSSDLGNSRNCFAS
jgi:hypothetical protein